MGRFWTHKTKEEIRPCIPILINTNPIYTYLTNPVDIYHMLKLRVDREIQKALKIFYFFWEEGGLIKNCFYSPEWKIGLRNNDRPII